MARTTGKPIKIQLDLVLPPDSTKQEAADMLRQLEREILEEDVQKVDRPPKGRAPRGAKAVEPFSLGTLLITLAASHGVLAGVVNVIKSWMERNRTRSVTLTFGKNKLDLKNLSPAEQQRLANEWLARAPEQSVPEVKKKSTAKKPAAKKASPKKAAQKKHGR